jgi:hypothetical protein
VRDSSDIAGPIQARSLEEHCRAPRALDDSKIVKRRFLGSREIQPGLYPAFAFPCRAMSVTIKLDGKMCFRTIEIDDITINRVLPSKFVICEIPIAQMTPQNLFTFGCVLAQITRTAHKVILYFGTVDCEKRNPSMPSAPHLSPLPTIGERRQEYPNTGIVT